MARVPSASDNLLVADIGGTHGRFALTSKSTPPAGDYLDLPTAGHVDAAELLRDALLRLDVGATGTLDVVLAVAGPVRDGRAQLTNLPWALEAGVLREQFGFRHVRLINDLEAAALGLAEHPPADVAPLRPGIETGGRNLLLSVGTGLGAAYWSRHEGRLHIEPAEAGHAGFAPAESWETEFLRMLQQRYGERISWERVLCGQGIALLDAFGRGDEPLSPAEVVHRAASGDTPASTALRRFSRLLGTFAGDLVLAAPAPGGVWLAGGVLARLGPLFDAQMFLQAFDAKGRLQPLLEAVPLRRVDDESLGIRGAWLAAKQALP